MSSKPKQPPVSEEGPTVEAAVLARLFSLTPTRISQLGKAGTLPKAKERGKYLLWPSIKNYIAELRDPKLNGYGRADGGGEAETLRMKRERKIDLECEKLDAQVKVMTGEHVSLESQKRKGLLISQTIRGQILRIPAELPQAIIGLEYVAAVLKCEEFADHMLEELHNVENYGGES
jgi:hypothetical protein